MNSATTTELHQQFKIPKDGVGYGYDRVFKEFLGKKVQSVCVKDSYIREPYQVDNFVRFCILLVQECGNLKTITLITSPNSQKNATNITNELNSLLIERGITLDFDYDGDLHARTIYFDNSWRVELDRGLDYFKPPENLSLDDTNLRVCKHTTITTIPQPDDQLCGSTQSTTVTIPAGSTGYGYDRVFAQCLDERLTSVCVVDPCVCEPYQVDNFFRFCELLVQKCDNLKTITLITSEKSWKNTPKSKLVILNLIDKAESTFGNRLDVKYERNPLSRKIDFDNGWTVIINHGLDYLFDDMSLRACKETKIFILRGKTSVNADLRSAPFESRLLSEYTERTKIGHGGFGVVFKARHKIDKKWYVIKQVDSPDSPDAVDAVDVADTEQSPNKVLREVHILAELDHPHIVRYYDAWLEKPPPGEELSQKDSNQPCLYIRMEWCSGSTLHEWLGENQLPEQRPISQTLDWFSQLVSAVKYIHDKKLIHRDIKPQNIFFGSSRDGAAPVLKIGDLGLAIDVAPSSSSGVDGNFTVSSSITSSRYTQNAGTPSYMSPEQPSGQYMNSTDIFSLGLVFLEMVQPFGTDAERCAVFGALQLGERPAVMNKLDKTMDVLIRRMTAFESGKRATSSELEHELRKILLTSETSFTDLPRKLMLKIFGYLYEDDLTRCTVVSRKFRAIASQILWKSLYQEIFEYSLPLLHVGHAQFEFREPHDWPQPRSDESIVVNPWKESFKQLKDGVHVRPGYASLYSGFGAGGRRLTQCDRLDQALQLVKARDENVEKLIFLHTGLYIPQTTVVINSDIQIIGASAGPDIASRVIIEGRLDTTVVLEEGSQGAYLAWMTVRCAPDPEAAAAVIAAGNPPMSMYRCALQICGDSTALVEHCTFHSSATVGAAVYVHGSAANPKMRHCVVCDCKNVGIWVTDAAQGQFEDCEIARNNLAGIYVGNRANPFFRRCHLHHGCKVGIYVTDAAQGQFKDCEIARNNLAGIKVNKRANPFFRRCHIHDERDAGIYTLNHGMGYFESCNIHNNRLAGIRVKSAANPTVTRCEVHHGQTYGIHVDEKGRGQFMENRIHSNALSGIEIESRAYPEITRNKIWGNQSGFFIHTNGQGVLEDNEIFDNAGAGVRIETNGNPTLRRNKIYDGRGEGVHISNKGRGLIEENEVYGNALFGIAVTKESSPIIRKNRIHSGKQAGVRFYDNGQGVLENNKIFDNAKTGVVIETGSNPKITRNKIRGNQEDGVSIYNNGQGVLEGNEIFNNAKAGVVIGTDSNPMLRHNKIYDGRGKGVLISDKGRGVLEDNDIYRNADTGVLILSKSNPTFRRNRVYEGHTAGIEIKSHSDPKIASNKIRGNQKGGVLIYDNGQGMLEENEIFDNAMAGVGIEADGNPMLRRNKIYDGRGKGVLISDKGRGVLEDNDIYRNADTGVLILSKSNPTFRRNRVYEGHAAGIEIANDAIATLESNAIFRNRFGGLFLATGVQPTLHDNKIYDNDDLVEKTIAKGGCLFEITSRASSPMHEIYRCDTCKMTEEDTICLNCIRTCHAEHIVHFVGYDFFFCDCGAGTLRDPCKLLNKSHDNSTLSVDFELQ